MNRAFETKEALEEAIARLGELLQAEGESWSVVIVGGAALNLLEIISRSTVDVDVLALGHEGNWRSLRRAGAELPASLAKAVETVARDLRLPIDWLNPKVGHGMTKAGVPPGLLTRVQWHKYDGLNLGIAARIDLIYLKLDAACDQPASRHLADLVQLAPSDEELDRAAAWCLKSTVGRETIIEKVTGHVRSRTA